MEEAFVLSKYASEITIIHRRGEFRASAVMQQKVLRNPKIKVLWNTEVVGVTGQEKLEKIVLKNTGDQSSSELVVDGLFIAIGHVPQSDIFKGIIEMDERGYITQKRDVYHTATNIPGVFVAGDIHDDHYRQAVTAAGSGCMAGMDALRYLEELKDRNKETV
jgi:thioredoxin reductase (NADPH)